MAKNKNKPINLLPKEEFDASITGRVLKWAMGTFRIIVIVTEMIVMGAFLSRFWLDARNSDLNDLLTIKSAQISSQSEFETEFRNLQDSLKIFKGITSATAPSNILDKVVTRLPSGISLQSFSFQEKEAQVKGIASSELAIAQFVSNLKADTFFSEVTLGQIGSSEGSPFLTVFNLKLTYSERGNN